MTGAELKAARAELGVGVVAFGRALGYLGYESTVGRQVRRLERSQRPVRPWVAAKVAELLGRHRAARAHPRDV